MINTFSLPKLNSKVNISNFENYNHFVLILFEKNGWYKIDNKNISAIDGQILFLNLNCKSVIKEIGGQSKLVVFSKDILVESLITNKNKIHKEKQQDNSNLLLLLISSFKEDIVYSFCVDKQKYLNLAAIINYLEEELETTQDFFKSTTSIIIKLIIIEVVRIYKKTSIKNLTCYDPLLEIVFQFIESHYHEAISLSDVAKYVHKSTSYLTNYVKQKTGKTVLQWIIELRMGKARSLLLETNLSVEKIAEIIGYIDIRHFSRQFRRIHGSSPKQWKLSNLQSYRSDDSLIG